jgi:hypothetical protein
MEATPQRVCENSKVATNESAGMAGTWADDIQCNIPQCSLGCCILADQGALVTLTRCKQLSGFYGLKTDFRRSITDEITCVFTAQGQDKGACVTEDSSTLARTCKFTTREKCSVGNLANEINGSSVGNDSVKGVANIGFYKDVLCSAEELGSICAPSKKTTLVEGKDEVYYLDTCGNLANIYDASKYTDKNYWKRVYKKSESCGYGTSNANSPTCGNCDYYYGSIGRKASGLLGFGKPTYGDYICIDLSCKEAGKKHGESWCETDSPSGGGEDPVGSRYFKEVCVFGEILTEPCADFRNEICIQDTFNGFNEAACRVNRWQKCTSQEEQTDCENEDTMDCLWIEGYYFSSVSGQIEKIYDEDEEGITEEERSWIGKQWDKFKGTNAGSWINELGFDGGTVADTSEDIPLTPSGLCVPNYPPGYQFWSANDLNYFTSATARAGQAGSGTGAGTGNIATSGSGLNTGTSGSGLNANAIADNTKNTDTKNPASSTASSTNSGLDSSASSGYGTGYIEPSSNGGNSVMCSLADAAVKVKWVKTRKPLKFWDREERVGEWTCIYNCQYAPDESTVGNQSPKITESGVEEWADEMNEICYKLGDCGGYINFAGEYTDDGYAAYYNNKRMAGSGGAEILEKKPENNLATSRSGLDSSGTGSSGASDIDKLNAGLQTTNQIAKTFDGSNNAISGGVIKDFIKSLVGAK